MLAHTMGMTGLTARQAPSGATERLRPAPGEIISGARARVADLAPHRRLIGGVLGGNIAILVAGGILYFGFDSRVVFVEKGLVDSIEAAELLLAGLFGLLAFAAFRRSGARNGRPPEAAGIFFWGLSGMVLAVLAVDDYFALHERTRPWIADNIGLLPLANSADDLITLTIGVVGLGVLYVFRRELTARRHSSTLITAGAAAAALMVAVDLYAKGWVMSVEFPLQVSAVGLLLLAYVMRYREVSAAPSASAATVVSQTEGGNGRC